MKKLYFLLFTLLFSGLSFGQAVFINEIHYDDAGASGDSGEGFEIAGPAGTNLSSYTVTLYNGSNGTVYNTIALSGTIPDEGGSGYGAVWFGLPTNGVQNGAPDGLSLDNGSLIQFLSYEGTFNGVGGIADGVTSTDIGVSETGSTPVGYSLQLTGSGLAYTDFSWSAATTATPGAINTGQTFGGTPVPTLTLVGQPASGSTIDLSPEDLSGELEFATTNFVVASPSVGDGYITWEIINVTDGNSVHDFGNIYDTSLTYPFATLDPNKTYLLTAELVDNSGASLSSPVVYTLTANTNGYIQVADIAALRTDVGNNGEGLYYEITGEAVITYIVTENTRHQKYVQDLSAGILIDDPNDVLATPFIIGDGITGLKGQTTSYNGVLEFVPTTSIGSASSTGNIISPQEISASELFTNGEDYESELIKVTNITFSDAGGTFTDNTNYNIVDGGTTTICRVAFGDEDLIGAIIPAGTSSVIGLGAEFNTAYQIYPRYLSDVEGAALSTKFNQIKGFAMYPNPTSLGYVNITSKSNANMSVVVFDMLGKQVINETVSNNTLNVSGLTSGLYLMKVTQDNAISATKLVIK